MPYLAAFGLTLLIEVPLYALVLKRLGLRRGVLAAATVNVVTHPLVWFLLTPPPAGAGRFVLVELGAWIVEFGLLLLWFRRHEAVLLATAFCANCLSCLIGLAFF